MLGERVLQVWWWYLHWFRRYRKKTRGGGAGNSPPPSGARVKLGWYCRQRAYNFDNAEDPVESNWSFLIMWPKSNCGELLQKRAFVYNGVSIQISMIGWRNHLGCTEIKWKSADSTCKKVYVISRLIPHCQTCYILHLWLPRGHIYLPTNDVTTLRSRPMTS